MCLHGSRDEKNEKEAVRLFRKAAKRGSEWAYTALGYCYRYGRGVEENYEEAKRYFRRGAHDGDSDGYIELALCYLNGREDDRDLEEAVRLLKRALTCRLYDSRVYSPLGWAYLNGEGVDQDIDQAVLHYWESSDFDDPDAQYLLGKIYSGYFENCEGRKDMTQAARYFRLAASNGHENACVQVSMILRDGQGVEKI